LSGKGESFTDLAAAHTAVGDRKNELAAAFTESGETCSETRRRFTDFRGDFSHVGEKSDDGSATLAKGGANFEDRGKKSFDRRSAAGDGGGG
jgi:hypothetical protein